MTKTASLNNDPTPDRPPVERPTEKQGELARHPVCGMRVEPATSEHRAEYNKQQFHFCSAGCRAKFIADPSRYLGRAIGPVEKMPTAADIYTCPMHPQIRKMKPGNCPICGMTLELVKVTAEVGENRELADMTIGNALRLRTLKL